jgi:transcriptional regulator with XRE-family HTH domain
MDELKISLRAARVNAGLTIQEAAKKMGVGYNRVLFWEQKPDTVQAKWQKIISETYGIPLHNLFFGI